MWVGFLAAIGASRLLPFFGSMYETAVEPVAAIVTCTLMAGLELSREGALALASRCVSTLTICCSCAAVGLTPAAPAAPHRGSP